MLYYVKPINQLQTSSIITKIVIEIALYYVYLIYFFILFPLLSISFCYQLGKGASTLRCTERLRMSIKLGKKM